MIYPPEYFDNCNGLIPQLVLSAMLLQAGNQRAASHRNALIIDQSNSTSWQLANEILSLSGVLPLIESRYLITQPSLISRVGAINSENASMVNDSVGLPVAGFGNHLSLAPVVLPPDIPHLSTEELIVEKRIAYLLLLLDRKNRLITLYNFIYWVYLTSKVMLMRSEISSASTSGGTASIQYKWGEVRQVSWVLISNVCIAELFKQYPLLSNLILSTTTIDIDDPLTTLTDWTLSQLTSDDPVSVPFIDAQAIESAISEKLDALKQEPQLPGSTGGVSGDVSSSIESNPDASPPLPPNSDIPNDDPLESYSSGNFAPLNPDRPDNSLPEC